MFSSCSKISVGDSDRDSETLTRSGRAVAEGADPKEEVCESRGARALFSAKESSKFFFRRSLHSASTAVAGLQRSGQALSNENI